ncbi:MAG: AbrB family transcriptional regulator [Thermoleophilaceae bacterium]
MMPAAGARGWTGVALATVALGWLAAGVGLPSSNLFAAIVVGLAVARYAPNVVAVSPLTFRGAQAFTGVVLGTYLHASTLAALGPRWLPVAAVSAATLGLTVAAGLALARATGLDRATASLGMVAGGASGIVAIAGELGADERLVAFMQYLRVLLIVLFTPILVRIAFPEHVAGARGAGAHEAIFGTGAGWALTLAVAVIGTVIAERVRLPGGALLGPLLLAAAITLLGASGGVQVPPLLREGAFAVIGLQVGLGFSRGTLREIARVTAPVIVAIAALGITCFGLAALLTAWAHVSLLDAYLATTPGGLYAVLATAFGSGADTTFVLAVQGVRLLVMIVAAPVVVRWLVRRGDDDDRGAPRDASAAVAGG